MILVSFRISIASSINELYQRHSFSQPALLRHNHFVYHATTTCSSFSLLHIGKRLAFLKSNTFASGRCLLLDTLLRSLQVFRLSWEPGFCWMAETWQMGFDAGWAAKTVSILWGSLQSNRNRQTHIKMFFRHFLHLDPWSWAAAASIWGSKPTR